MHKLAMQRAQGVKKVVEFNDLGQPIGQIAAEMQSYIGVLAREKVKVNYKTWKHVPEDIKEKIWEAINLTFIVSPQFKKSCLSSANDKWRQYKTHLTNNFIWNRLNDEENLHKPPVGSGIMGDEWSQFVITRMSDDFKKLSEQQKERRKQNLYPHRIARKGYARLASELSTELCDGEEVNRAILWKKGRMSKQGEIQGDVLKATLSKIGENVALTLEEETDDIVAYGIIISINCNMLTIDCMYVAIDQAVAINAPLPFTLSSSCQHVGDVVGSHVNWPTRHLSTTRTDTKFLEEQLENKAQAIADRLLNTPPNTTVLVPFININKDIVYMLDPLGPRLRSDDWKHVVDM
nr:putative transposase, Ptta/En/Spm, plant [Ipomoea batatas]